MKINVNINEYYKTNMDVTVNEIACDVLFNNMSVGSILYVKKDKKYRLMKIKEINNSLGFVDLKHVGDDVVLRIGKETVDDIKFYEIIS